MDAFKTALLRTGYIANFAKKSHNTSLSHKQSVSDKLVSVCQLYKILVFIYLRYQLEVANYLCKVYFYPPSKFCPPTSK